MFTVGCEKDDDVSEGGTDVLGEISDTFTDIDGNVYHTVVIGFQTWAVENLKTTKYNDGTPIPNVTDDHEWVIVTTGPTAITITLKEMLKSTEGYTTLKQQIRIC
jgi:hypothetical protein